MRPDALQLAENQSIAHHLITCFSYVQALHILRLINTGDTVMAEIPEEIPIQHVIGLTFLWQATPEGHQYWRNRNKKWLDYCNELRHPDDKLEFLLELADDTLATLASMEY